MSSTAGRRRRTSGLWRLQSAAAAAAILYDGDGFQAGNQRQAPWLPVIASFSPCDCQAIAVGSGTEVQPPLPLPYDSGDRRNEKSDAIGEVWSVCVCVLLRRRWRSLAFFPWHWLWLPVIHPHRFRLLLLDCRIFCSACRRLS